MISVDNRDALAGLEQTRRAAVGTAGQIGQAFAAVQTALVAVGFVAITRQIADVGIAAEAAGVRLNSLASRFGEADQAQIVAGNAAKLLNLSLTEAQGGFAQLYASLRPTGVSLQQIETIFVGVTAAAKNTGLGAESVNNALIQLTQGLASGRLQGDELRSVLEQLPPLSQAIAKELNVPVGSLKQLGSEGKITTDIIIKALERLKATELGSLAKSLGTSQEAMKGLANATQTLQVEISNLFGSETLQGVRTLTGAVGDLATLVKAAARASKELKENLPKQVNQDSIRTGSLPVDFLIKQSDVISQGKFSNELAYQWKSLIGQAKLYGEAKNIALAAGRYIPPEQQIGYVPPGKGKTSEPPQKPPQALVDAAKLSQQRLTDLQSTIGLEGSVLQIVQQQLQTQKAISEQARLQSEYDAAKKKADAAGGINAALNAAADQAKLRLDAAGSKLRADFLQGSQSAATALKGAADRFKSAGESLRSSLEGAFKFLTPQIQEQLTDRAQQDIKAAQSAGIFRADVGLGATPEELLGIGGSARGVLAATKNFDAAGKDLVNALDAVQSPLISLAEKDWQVVVNVASSGMASVSGDVLGGVA
jgi:tape measure domain-containing protein